MFFGRCFVVAKPLFRSASACAFFKDTCFRIMRGKARLRKRRQATAVHISLFFAGDDFGDVERVVFHAAVEVEHVRVG